MSRKAPPPLPSSPAEQIHAAKTCTALYDWTGTDSNQLTFCAGDVIEIVAPGDEDWWTGRFKDVVGYFPVTYTDADRSACAHANRSAYAHASQDSTGSAGDSVGDASQDSNAASDAAVEATVAKPKEPEKDEDPAEKRQRMKTKVAQEIVDSELSYVNSLRVLIDLYVHPLSPSHNLPPLDASSNSAGSASPRASLLDDNQSKQLFSVIVPIFELSQKFHSDLDRAVQAQHGLGDVFVRMMPFLKMYKTYVNNYDEASQLLQQLLDNNQKFRAFHDEALANPRSANLSLASYLVMPVQRIPRYKLLLTELIRHTDAAHPDSPALTQANEQVSKLATELNEAMKEHESRTMVWQLQAQFTGNLTLVAPHRAFIRQGVLSKVGENYDNEYFFFLFNDLLLYASKTVTGRYKCHRIFAIDSSFSIEPLTVGWKITSGATTFVAYARDEAENKAWFDAISKCLSQSKNAIQIPRESSTDAAAEVTEDQCKLCNQKFSFINRRHHCRKCGRAVCSGCSRSRIQIGSQTNQRGCDRCAGSASSMGLASVAEKDKEKEKDKTPVTSPRSPADVAAPADSKAAHLMNLNRALSARRLVDPDALSSHSFHSQGSVPAHPPSAGPAHPPSAGPAAPASFAAHRATPSVASTTSVISTTSSVGPPHRAGFAYAPSLPPARPPVVLSPKGGPSTAPAAAALPVRSPPLHPTGSIEAVYNFSLDENGDNLSTGPDREATRADLSAVYRLRSASSDSGHESKVPRLPRVGPTLVESDSEDDDSDTEQQRHSRQSSRSMSSVSGEIVKRDLCSFAGCPKEKYPLRDYCVTHLNVHTQQNKPQAPPKIGTIRSAAFESSFLAKVQGTLKQPINPAAIEAAAAAAGSAAPGPSSPHASPPSVAARALSPTLGAPAATSVAAPVPVFPRSPASGPNSPASTGPASLAKRAPPPLPPGFRPAVPAANPVSLAASPGPVSPTNPASNASSPTDPSSAAPANPPSTGPSAAFRSWTSGNSMAKPLVFKVATKK